MHKVHRWFAFLVMLAVLAPIGIAQADGIHPAWGNQREGNLSFEFPYAEWFFTGAPFPSNSAFEYVYHQRIPGAGLCPNPSAPFTNTTAFVPAPVTGIDGAGPFKVQGLQVRPDWDWYQVFPASSRTWDGRTVHYLTDYAPNTNWIFTNMPDNLNFTTVAFPGSHTLNYASSPSGAIPGSNNFVPITTVGEGFNHLGVENRGPFPDALNPGFFGPYFSGTCDAPEVAGLLIDLENRAIVASSGTPHFTDADFTISYVGSLSTVAQSASFARWGVRRTIRQGWQPGLPDTFMEFFSSHGGTVYKVITAGCKTYADLKKEIVNAVITGNPPSNPPGGASGTTKDDQNFQGLRNAFFKKAVNSEAAFNRGRTNSAGNTLGALMSHVDAQDGKHLDSDSAQDLRDCITQMASSLGLSVGPK